MSDDEKDFGICKYCEDERGLCDGIFLDDDRRFSIKLDENFEVDTVSHNDKSFFVIKHDICFICFNLYFFYYSTSVSPAMQEFLSWIDRFQSYYGGKESLLEDRAWLYFPRKIIQFRRLHLFWMQNMASTMQDLCI